MERQRLGILVGGGPAPGINSVVAAATIRARLDNVDVIGIEDGFEWLVQGDATHVRPLTSEGVSRNRGSLASALMRIAAFRRDPSKSPCTPSSTSIIRVVWTFDVRQCAPRPPISKPLSEELSHRGDRWSTGSRPAETG